VLTDDGFHDLADDDEDDDGDDDGTRWIWTAERGGRCPRAAVAAAWFSILTAMLTGADADEAHADEADGDEDEMQ
jgi:hypothetical protein